MHWARYRKSRRGRFLGQRASCANFYGPVSISRERLLVPVEEELAVVRAFGHRVITTRRPVEGGAGDRSRFVGCSSATFLVPATGRECGPTRNPILAAGWAAAADGSSERIVPRDAC
jgi:hypothetical protein